MELLAHITRKNGIRMNQSLREHCIHTAKYASLSLEHIGLGNMAYLAGLLHDMGKATKKFNDYLEKSYNGEHVIRGSVNHTFAGVIYLLELYHGTTASVMGKFTAEVISYAIGAHHGLFDCVDLEGKNGFSHRLNKDRVEICYEEARNNFFEQIMDEAAVSRLFEKAVEEFTTFYHRVENDWEKSAKKVFFQISLLVRILLSAVIYGDRRDTSEFMNDIFCSKDQSYSWISEREYLEQKLRQFPNTSKINQVRCEISDQCKIFAEKPTGIYRLNVPTGGGKTLCTLRYALTHAEKYHKRRIIFIIPLLSILDQNVKVIKEYIKDESMVVEHHSNVVYEKETTEEIDHYEILTENWDAPIIVSTLVQLLDILFAHKTSFIGRMRALCDSVIIIDEVQSLPKKTMAMFNMAINFLKTYCNATIVLSSATQPCFEELSWPIRFTTQPDMVCLNEQQHSVFERADIIDKTSPYGMNMEECVVFCKSLIEKHNSLLVICNTKREAQDLYKALQESEEVIQYSAFHLSTSMCQKHRTDVLEEIQDRLNILQENISKQTEKEKIICISTQLVEAGVDFSFECVVRVLAGIDNLAQAAGRCNRSNEYAHKGKVYLINLKDENLSMLKEISEAQTSTRNVVENKTFLGDESLIGQRATSLFYKYLFQGNKIKKRIKYPINDCGTELLLAHLLANDNPYAKGSEFFLRQPFQTAGREFQVFDNETFDILVPYKEGKEVIEELKEIEKISYILPSLKKLVQKAKLYTVSIYKWQKEKLWEQGLLYGIFEDRFLVLDTEAYNEKYGLNDNNEQVTENYIL